MEDTNKRLRSTENSDKEILYSKSIKAGKRIYYLDVKRNLRDDWFLAITESKKIQLKDSAQVVFERHKIFLYKEDFEKFVAGMLEVIDYIKKQKESDAPVASEWDSEKEDVDPDEIKLDIDF
jgi:hypothetical protein